MRFLIICIVTLLFSNTAIADSDDKTIVRTGTINEDTYLAGERLKVDATIDGDLVLAAGDMSVSGQVSGDLMAAGGEISITAKLADDVRAAGGEISLCTTVAGDAVLAGGDIDICKDNVILSKAWIAGGDVTIDGRVEQNVSIRAGNVRLAGTFLRDVNIQAGSIEVLDGAKILGDLNYKSPNPAKIQSDASIVGKENYEVGETWWSKKGGDWSTKDILKLGLGFFFFVVLSALLTAFTLSKLLPETYGSTDKIIRERFLPCLAIGLIVTLITPMILILLAMTVVGISLAWIGLLLYLLILVIGSYAALLFIAEILFQKIKPNQAHTNTSKALSILGAIVLLLIVGLIPLLGGVVIFLVYLTGVGALSMHLYERCKEPQQINSLT